jgi:hypothetical protein
MPKPDRLSLRSWPVSTHLGAGIRRSAESHRSLTWILQWPVTLAAINRLAFDAPEVKMKRVILGSLIVVVVGFAVVLVFRLSAASKPHLRSPGNASQPPPSADVADSPPPHSRSVSTQQSAPPLSVPELHLGAVQDQQEPPTPQEATQQLRKRVADSGTSREPWTALGPAVMERWRQSLPPSLVRVGAIECYSSGCTADVTYSQSHHARKADEVFLGMRGTGEGWSGPVTRGPGTIDAAGEMTALWVLWRPSDDPPPSSSPAQ